MNPFHLGLSYFMGIYAALSHAHDDRYYTESESDLRYSLLGHNHDLTYAAIAHNHDLLYSAIGHDHDSDYSAIGHDHDTDYSNTQPTLSASRKTQLGYNRSRLGC